MTENVKNSSVYYPLEAFALAMVLYSSGMKTAMIVGIGIVFGDVLLHVLKENFNNIYGQALSGVGIVATAAAITYMCSLTGIEWNLKTVIGFGLLGVLLVKHHEDLKEEEPDYNKILLGDSIAYLFMVLLAIIREFISGGQIFDSKLVKLGFMSHSYGKVMFAMILAGIVTGILNAIFKVKAKDNAAVWVCIPIIILEAPFVWNNVPEWLGTIIAVVFMLIVYITFRKKISMPRVSESFKGLPIELLTLGMMYMIFSIL